MKPTGARGRALARLASASLALVACGAAAAVHAQDAAWRWELPQPQGNTIRSACVDAGGAIWIAGEAGTLGSIDARGQQWRPSAPSSDADLQRVACCPRGVVAVGAAGVVARHEGADVSVQTLPGAALLTGVACDGPSGVVVSSSARELFVSDDGGRTFARRAAPHPLYAIHVVGGAFVASGPDGAIVRSTDRGATWSGVGRAAGNVLAFAGDAPELYAVGAAGAALRSTDGGASWSSISTDVREDLVVVTRSARGETIALGAAGAAISLRATSAARIGSLERAHHALVAVGGGWLAAGAGGRIALRRASGPFRPIARREESLYAAFDDGRTRLVVGDRGVVLRAEGDRPLAVVRSGTVVALHAVRMSARGVALAAGADGVVLRSQDRGRTWRRVPLSADRTFNSVWLDDEGHALVVGERGQRFRSDDGGRTWESVSLDRDVQFTGIAAHGGSLWVVASGRIERSDDLGRTWQSEAVPVEGADLRAPFVTEQGTWIVAARPGTVHRRVGGRWTRSELGSDAVITGISGHGATLVAVTSAGAIFESRDDGASWTRSPTLTREVLTSVAVGATGRAWITGYWGTLLTRR